MSLFSLPRILIGAAASGSGKTTVTCGIMQALLNRGLRLSSFKCGPDYIDPMFHSRIIGAASRNLDLFFTGEETVKALLLKHSKDADLALMEGVMGYYDGVAGKTAAAGAYDLARVTGAPSILVLQARGMSLSLAALINGFVRFRPDSGIRGVILNRCPPALYPLLKEIIETETDVRPLGYLPDMAEAAFESRHLGLVTAAEVKNLKDKLQQLAVQCEKTLDLDGILELAAAAPALTAKPLFAPRRVDGAPRIAVARDEAFCFHYEDNYDLLREAGADIVFFSPLQDHTLPDGTAGLFLGGGYPELHARTLSGNKRMLECIGAARRRGLPTIAECGGFLYLHDQLEDDTGCAYPMAGVVKGRASKSGRMGHFGYAAVTAGRDNLLCRAGESIRAHEFHYWQSDNEGGDFHAEKPVTGKSWPCVHADGSLYAGFPHLYFYANPRFAESFAAACAAYAAADGSGRRDKAIHGGDA
ncbi:MAG: cobyrinic acid a,c-diamide synthase [Paenibacillaceae bacterium]|jgi:cobyrinic acid a,c-diamide synthase|nr:cobyrinic acid a,c-diamide synthase [Paenibacillaceae bacterium]